MNLYSHDLISTIVTVNGIWLGFIATMYTNILAISKSSIIELLKTSPYKNHQSRLDHFLAQIKLTCLVNFISIVLGILLLSDFFRLFQFLQLSKIGVIVQISMFVIFAIIEILALVKMYNLYGLSHTILNFYAKSKES